MTINVERDIEGHQEILMQKISFLVIFLVLNCNLVNSKKSFNDYLYFALGNFISFQDEGELPPPLDIVPPPKVNLNQLSIFDQNSISVSPASMESPKNIEGVHVPVGKIYDITYNSSAVSHGDTIPSISFNEEVTLVYKYDKEKLIKEGFVEEFAVYYFDHFAKNWVPLENVVVDTEKSIVYAKTNHFTPFVLTALPTLTNSGIVEAPSCFAESMPLSGSGNASWSRIDANFKYYKDRSYTIVSSADFYDLGLQGSYGLATCNGGTNTEGLAYCGSLNEHKYNQNLDYINFITNENIVVYIMYDRRGTEVAPWLNNEGWLLLPQVIRTTDAVGYYKVFSKTFESGSLVRLHGNRNGLPSNSAIDTNYWIVIKGLESKPNTCLSKSESFENPLPILTAFAGNDNATILWGSTEKLDISNVILRRKKNSPADSPADGIPVSGTEIGKIGFKDYNLEQNTIYYYTLYALNKEGVLSLGSSIRIKTGSDSDNDNISDEYESESSCFLENWIPGICSTKPNLSDSDGDGIDDYSEIISQKNPLDGDQLPPKILYFISVNPSSTSLPVVDFYIQTDNDSEVDSWLLKRDSNPPTNFDINWQATKPSRIELQSTGEYKFYVWAKDKAGNISQSVNPVVINLFGYSYPEFVVKASGTKVYFHKQNLLNGSLNLAHTFDIGINVYDGNGYITKNGKYLIIRTDAVSGDNDVRYLDVYRINFAENTLLLTDRLETTMTRNFAYSPDEKYIYAGDYYSYLRKIEFDTQNGKFINSVWSERTRTDYATTNQVILNPDQTRDLLYAFDDSKYYILNAKSMQILYSSNFQSLYNVNKLKFHPTGNYLFVWETQGLVQYSINTFGGLSYLRTVVSSAKKPTLFDISNDGHNLIVIEDYKNVCNYKINLDGTLELLDIFEISNINIHSVKIDPSSNFVYVEFELSEDQLVKRKLKLYQINRYNNKLSELATNETGNYSHPFLDFFNIDNVKSKFQFKLAFTNEPTLLRETLSKSKSLGQTTVEYFHLPYEERQIVQSHHSLLSYYSNTYTIKGSFYDDKFDICNKSPEHFTYNREIYTAGLPLEKQNIYNKISTPINQIFYYKDLLWERFERMNIYLYLNSVRFPASNDGYILTLNVTENSSLCDESINSRQVNNYIFLRKSKVTKVTNFGVSLVGEIPQNLPLYTSVRNHQSGFDFSQGKAFFTPTVYNKLICLYDYSICNTITNTCGSRQKYLREQYTYCTYKPEGIQINSNEYIRIFSMQRKYENLWRWDSFDIQNFPNY
ncbi:hypothetical protein CH381_21265 [Leptospira sp. mixed culture ATI2-C-A1]|nr:hypothetical protein CH381_21265 [Leptospira sp. mixed culture ATI2-C-A1]